ncbi:MULTISPECIES: hypothetical protein [unclassified Pseudomonas]|uniref:Uncharacterized protein n=1 Tax=Pseudomonas sp. MYb327 TaxID=2745230 RepID=A0AAU8E458_9PSED
MNINAAASFQITPLQPLKANTEKHQLEKVESREINEGRARLTIEKLMAPQRMGISIDDLDELDEFLKTTSLGPGSGDLSYRMENFRDTILRGNEFRAAETLRTMERVYSDFKQDLHSKWPALADKVFGFTVSEDGRLQVTSPLNTLDAREKETLDTLLNDYKNLQFLTLKHAKAVIELVQQDKQQFEGKVKLDVTNFHKMIDYGLLLNKGALQVQYAGSWLDQLHKNAEKDPIEKNQGLHIEA